MTKIERTKKAIADAQADGMPHLGDVVTWTLHGDHPRTRVLALAEQYGIAEDLGLRAWQGTLRDIRSGYIRAVNSVVNVGKTDERRFEAVRMEANADFEIHAVCERRLIDTGIQQGAVPTTMRPDLDTAVQVALDKKAFREGTPVEACIVLSDPANPLAREIRAAYDREVVNFQPQDIRSAFQGAFRRWGGMPLNDHGGAWWIPAVAAAKVRGLESFLRDIGSTVTVIEVFETARTVEGLRASARANLEGQIQDILAQLSTFNDRTRLATMEQKLDEFDALRDRAALYERLLGATMGDLKANIDAAQTGLVESITGRKAAAAEAEEQRKVERAAARAARAAGAQPGPLPAPETPEAPAALA